MAQAQIVGYDPGFHNTNEKTIMRLVSEGSYKDQSCVVIIPALNSVATKAASSWWNLIFPPNQKVVKLFAHGMEVGEAYSQTIQTVLDHPDLSKFKYIVTIEADNVLPPDGVLKMIRQLDVHPEYACVGGLYYTRGEGGCPQLWGDPADPILNFRPQVPRPGELQEVCGTGMGANCWRLDMFRDPKLRKPWFRTLAGPEGVGTQDLAFWTDARKHGYRCAIDNSILVGHVDMSSGFVW